jgi:hypothetical protein
LRGARDLGWSRYIANPTLLRVARRPAIRPRQSILVIRPALSSSGADDESVCDSMPGGDLPHMAFGLTRNNLSRPNPPYILKPAPREERANLTAIEKVSAALFLISRRAFDGIVRRLAISLRHISKAVPVFFYVHRFEQ